MNEIEKIIKKFEEKFSRQDGSDEQRGAMPQWFFPETTTPREVSNWFREELTELVSKAEERGRMEVHSKDGAAYDAA